MTGFDGNQNIMIIGHPYISANLYENAKNYVASLFGGYRLAPVYA